MLFGVEFGNENFWGMVSGSAVYLACLAVTCAVWTLLPQTYVCIYIYMYAYIHITCIHTHVGGSQSYGPLSTRYRIILRTQKGTIILTTTHMCTHVSAHISICQNMYFLYIHTHVESQAGQGSLPGSSMSFGLAGCSVSVPERLTRREESDASQVLLPSRLGAAYIRSCRIYIIKRIKPVLRFGLPRKHGLCLNAFPYIDPLRSPCLGWVGLLRPVRAQVRSDW